MDDGDHGGESRPSGKHDQVVDLCQTRHAETAVVMTADVCRGTCVNASVKQVSVIVSTQVNMSTN